MPQLARTRASVLPPTLHAQRTGLLKSLSSADSRSMSTKPENAVSVKLGSSTIPKRMRSRAMGETSGDGSTAFMQVKSNGATGATTTQQQRNNGKQRKRG